jgi:mono/diheme cytochrome c family protein
MLAALCVAPLLAGCEKRSPEEALWRKHCADCHGIDGSGNTARYMGNHWANLLDNAWKSSGSDEYSITHVVREGVFGEMPGNSALSDEEVSQIVDWLYYLRGEMR